MKGVTHCTIYFSLLRYFFSNVIVLLVWWCNFLNIMIFLSKGDHGDESCRHTGSRSAASWTSGPQDWWVLCLCDSCVLSKIQTSWSVKVVEFLVWLNVFTMNINTSNPSGCIFSDFDEPNFYFYLFIIITEFPNPDRRQKRLVFTACTQKMNLADEVRCCDVVMLCCFDM